MAEFRRKAMSLAVDAVALAVLIGSLGLIARSRLTGAGAGRSAPPLLALREPGRGRHAETPVGIPMRGWRDIFKRTWKEFQEDHITLVAAGITFYSLLAFFPGVAAFVALYGLFANVQDARDQFLTLAVILPPDTVRFVGDQMVQVAAAHTGGLSLTFATGLALSLWSANGAAKAIFLGLNIAYEETEKRGFVRLTLVSFAFTLGLLAFFIVLLAAAVAVPTALVLFGYEAQQLVRAVIWPLLALAIWGAVTLLYRYGPSRERARWRWISWGAAFVTLFWIAASWAFSLWLGSFAHYDKTYGPLGAVIGFMMWTYLSAVIVLAGAELNAEMEHQTGRDTTTGEPLPLGARGAQMADTIGAAQR
ncbi:membrane protein [Caulobacter ginsengisoli]|uniref:Membrane protein n=1 Tax=Caulobacter ginsengisoli TaxID=400775 RepID=A0ABU0IXI5_9CAUL|nr:YihY/virulence factor BrkB family protein [Caulobacter ginsengisoli]MDQ0466728.1 membrane protein [Caulobacter ginsengisoli]